MSDTSAQVTDQEDGGKGSEALAKAQRERPQEQVGAPYGHGSVRRVTSDELDPHRDWTVQSGRPFPQPDQGRTTRFHPAELPDPQKSVDAGLMPQLLPPNLIDDTHITQPPTENVPLDHPLRKVNDGDPGYDAWKQTNTTVGLEDAQRQRRMTGSWEDRNGQAGDVDPDGDLPEVANEGDRANARLKAKDADGGDASTAPEAENETEADYNATGSTTV
jgi:hypothetical protein